MDSNHVDITEVVEDWAMNYFRGKASSDEKKLMDRNQILLELDWKRLRFTHKPPVYVPEAPVAGSGVPINNTIFKTTFANRTDTKQTYTFRTSRSTRSTCTVELQKAFTKSSNMETKLAIPGNIMEANAGFSRELQLSRTDGETIEQELQWAVDSQVEVKEKYRCHAKVVIIEEEYTGKFTLKTFMRGVVRAVFTNARDNNSFLLAAEAPIEKIVEWAKKAELPNTDLLTADNEAKRVSCVTKGKCTFRYGLRQDIEVEQEPLSDS